MKFRQLAAELVFWSHLPFPMVWVGLFFVPKSFWPEKVVFHFWFIVVVFSVQLLWGVLFISRRKRLGFGVCPLTTLSQRLRGYFVFDPKNYDHVFIDELFERIGFKPQRSFIQALFLGTLFLVALQYFFS